MIILVIYCYIKNYPIINSLKQQTFTISVFWAWSLAQGLSKGWNQGVVRGFGHIKVQLWEQLLTWLLTCLMFLLAGDQIHHFFAIWASHQSSSTWQLVSFRVSEWESQRRSLREKLQSFCNLALEVVSHHFRHILFIRNESLSSGHIQRKRLHRGRDIRG